MIYFDNAATTRHKPEKVISALVDAVQNYSVNPLRGTSKTAAILEEKITATRKKLGILLGCENVVFTQNCTSALNLAILGSVKRGGHVITTVTEHNSVLRPLMHLKQRGFIDVSAVAPSENGKIYPRQIEEKIRSNTYLVIVNHVSNVTGESQDVWAIGNALRRYPQISFLVDGAQSIGYLPLDAHKSNISFVAIPTHKGLHSVCGCGCLGFSKNPPRPIVFGGTGSESHSLLQPTTIPDGLESGTQNVPAILATSAAIDWWAEEYPKNTTTLFNYTSVLCENLASIKNVQIYSKPNKCGIVSFNVGQIDSAIIADELAKADFAVRAGLHCAPLMHKFLKTDKTGTVRISLAFDNTLDEIYKFLNVLEQISNRLCK